MENHGRYIQQLIRADFDAEREDFSLKQLFKPIRAAEDLGFKELADEMKSDLELGELAEFNKKYQ